MRNPAEMGPLLLKHLCGAAPGESDLFTSGAHKKEPPSLPAETSQEENLSISTKENRMHHNSIALPSEKVLFERLLEVNKDPYFKMCLYRKILESAGQQKTAMGVVDLLRIAICECAGTGPLVEASILVWMPKLIDALVIDKGVAEEAKEYFERQLAMSV